MDRIVKDYHGEKVRVVCSEEEIPGVLFRRFIEPFIAELEYSWMRSQESDIKVKGYLDYIASLMIRKPAKNGIIDDRKMRRIHEMEITGRELDDPGVNVLPVKTKRQAKPRFETRTQRIDKIHREHPGCKISICMVDTAGCFRHGSRTYQVSTELDQYSAKSVGDDVLYDMDRIMVVEDSKGLFFYDQDARPVDGANVRTEIGRL